MKWGYLSLLSIFKPQKYKLSNETCQMFTFKNALNDFALKYSFVPEGACFLFNPSLY